MNTLALDLSKTRTGWAVYFDADIREHFDGPGWEAWADWEVYKTGNRWSVWERGNSIESSVFGSWPLGSEHTPRGQVFDKLMRNLDILHGLTKFQNVYYEQPITPQALSGHTTIDTLRITLGLPAALEAFCHTYRYQNGFWDGVRKVQDVNVTTWRGSFIGTITQSDVKAKTRRARKAGNSKASSTAELKELTKGRARQLGFKPRNDDEGDAIGLLTWAIENDGWQAPWLADEVLRQPLGKVA